MATNNNSKKQVTPLEIREHRVTSKRAGMLSCEPAPATEFRIVFGYSDIATWRPEDPMDPHCFCFYCRDTWDSDGSIDAELVNKGHKDACKIYASLLESK